MAADSLILLQRAIGSTVQPPDDPLSERILDAALSTRERREGERPRLRRGERTPQVAA